MIISFDRSPEAFYRLACTALEKDDLGIASVYCERAIGGKGLVEYKMTLADIYLRMGRKADAMDVAVDVLCHSRGEKKAEAYELMARASNALGKSFESLYYLTKRAQMEGEEAAIDVMGELVDEMMIDLPDEPERHLYLVGGEPDHRHMVERAVFCMQTGDLEHAIEEAARVPEKSDYYEDAMDIILRCATDLRRKDLAAQYAREALAHNQKDALALYVLIAVCGESEYIPLLTEVEEDPSSLHYAMAAADAAGDAETAKVLVKRLLAANQYSPEAYFACAGVFYNAGEKDKCISRLKDLFSISKKYPATVILDGVEAAAGEKHFDLIFGNVMPRFIADILREYVRAHTDSEEDFCRSMMSDADFRAALTLLYEANDDETIENTLDFVGGSELAEVDAFFEKLLLKTNLTPMTKRDVLAELLLSRHKGTITIMPGVIPVRVRCAKPPKYAAYPRVLQEAYVDAYAFAMCVMDVSAARAMQTFAPRFFADDTVWRDKEEDEITAALICVSLGIDAPPPNLPIFTEDVCEYICRNIFDMEPASIDRVRSIVQYFRPAKG